MEELNWINSRERFSVPKNAIKPKVDKIVSGIVGKTVYMQDPRLIGLIVKWKKGKSQDSMTPDNFFQDPKKVAELKEAFSKDL